MSISQPEFVQVQFVWLTLTPPVEGEELMDLGYESSCSSFPFLYFYLLAPLQKDIFSVLLITEQPASPLSCLCHSWFVSCLDSNLYIFRRGGGGARVFGASVLSIYKIWQQGPTDEPFISIHREVVRHTARLQDCKLPPAQLLSPSVPTLTPF